MKPEPSESHDDRLAETLTILGSPVRLAMLRQLRSPRTLREIEVKSLERRPGAARTLSRQAVREHLDRLLRIGAVVTRPAERSHGETVEYLLNHQTLFAVSEEFRELARLRPSSEPSNPTVLRPSPLSPFAIEGPCVVLVKGLEEGRSFPLVPPARGKGRWVVGRKRDADVPLDFDPFVSTENTRFTWSQGKYSVEDLPESRNGTTLNFRPLPKGLAQPLQTGDLVGVGRSILMFRG